jgi:hypothetical protein
VQQSDAVMMDLRGFRWTNQGCIVELHVLLDTVPLDRILLVVDGTTDEAFSPTFCSKAGYKSAPIRGIEPRPIRTCACITSIAVELNEPMSSSQDWPVRAIGA